MIYDILFVIAQAQAGPKNPLIQFFPIILVVIIMYYVLFRLPKKERARREAMLDAIKTGDKVITAGGIHGIVSNVKEKSFLIKIADNVKIEVSKGGVTTVVDAGKKEGKNEEEETNAPNNKNKRKIK